MLSAVYCQTKARNNNKNILSPVKTKPCGHNAMANIKLKVSSHLSGTAVRPPTFSQAHKVHNHYVYFSLELWWPATR